MRLDDTISKLLDDLRFHEYISVSKVVFPKLDFMSQDRVLDGLVDKAIRQFRDNTNPDESSKARQNYFDGVFKLVLEFVSESQNSGSFSAANLIRRIREEDHEIGAMFSKTISRKRGDGRVWLSEFLRGGADGELCSELIKAGASPLVPESNQNGSLTPLSLAKTTESAEVLIANGADVNSEDNPLSCAARHKKWGIYELLIEKGADPFKEKTEEFGRVITPLSELLAWKTVFPDVCADLVTKTAIKYGEERFIGKLTEMMDGKKQGVFFSDDTLSYVETTIMNGKFSSPTPRQKQTI